MDREDVEDAPARVVVGVAVVRDGQVLAARRTRPAAVAGGWEFPGGKVEPGESEAEAARREVAEELGCGVVVGPRLDGEVVLSGGLVLRVYVAELVGGEPAPTEHDAVRWLGLDTLDDVPWLDADRPFLPAVAAVLRRTEAAGPAEAHFDEGDDAEDVLATLRAEGYEATLHREAFAGEDDSEDRAWLVRVDGGPAGVRLRALVAAYELAWMVDDATPPAPPPPLPTAPRRLKRPR